MKKASKPSLGQTKKNSAPSIKKTAKKPSGFEEAALARLKEKGFRITMPRVQVIRVLGEEGRAMSAYGIHEQILAVGGRIDVVSVYRILATLAEVGLIHHIGVVDGYIACRLNDHHHEASQHIVCESCLKVTELGIPEQTLKTTYKQVEPLGFSSKLVKMEVVGLCADCQKS